MLPENWRRWRVCVSESIPARSLHWFPVSRASDQPLKIISSDSSGRLHLLQVSEAGPGLQHVATWQAHHFEAWIAAFNYWQTETVYSGEHWRAVPSLMTGQGAGRRGLSRGLILDTLGLEGPEWMLCFLGRRLRSAFITWLFLGQRSTGFCCRPCEVSGDTTPGAGAAPVSAPPLVPWVLDPGTQCRNPVRYPCSAGALGVGGRGSEGGAVGVRGV